MSVTLEEEVRISRQDGRWVAVWRTMLDVVDEVVH